MPTEPPLPPPPASPAPPSHTSVQDELVKDRYGHELDAWLERWKQQVTAEAVAAALVAAREDARVARVAAREDAVRAAEKELLASIHAAYIDVTKSSLERALTRLNVLTASVASVITVYTGLLALVYAAEPGKGKQLTAAAVVPALFLGAALTLASVYAAIFRNKTEYDILLPTGIGGTVAEERLVTFMRWCFAGVLARAWALHAGVVSLAVGIATLPLPFLALSGAAQVVIFLAGALAVGATGGISAWRAAHPSTG